MLFTYNILSTVLNYQLICCMLYLYIFVDIPDWCHVEVRGKSCYDFSSCAAPSLQAMESMYKKSPLALVDRVKTPTLFVLGGHDRRVPPAQGLEYYHILRSRGVPVQVMWFPEDNHSIDRPASEIEQWMATLMWIEKYNKD